MATKYDESIDTGKRRVEEAIQRLAGEHNLPVRGLRWKDDFPGAYLYSVYFDVQDASDGPCIELSVRQLEACSNPANQSARAGLEDQIRSCLRDVIQRLEQSRKNK